MRIICIIYAFVDYRIQWHGNSQYQYIHYILGYRIKSNIVASSEITYTLLENGNTVHIIYPLDLTDDQNTIYK